MPASQREPVADEGLPAYIVEARRRWPNAYEPWSPRDDEGLLAAWTHGSSISELAKDFGRSPGAIRSRLEHLNAPSVPDDLDYRARYSPDDKPNAREASTAHNEEEPFEEFTAWFKRTDTEETIPRSMFGSATLPSQREPNNHGTPEAARIRNYDKPPESEALMRGRWLELAILVECGECFADPGEPCRGSSAQKLEPGWVMCASRPGEVPVVTAPTCAADGCRGSCVDRPGGWTQHCWMDLGREEKERISAERVTIGWGADPKRYLGVDVEAAFGFACPMCPAEAGVKCVGRRVERTGQPHEDRVRQARDHRRARLELETELHASDFWLR